MVLATQEAIQSAINLAYDLSRSTAKEFFQEMHDESTDSLISEIEETGDLLDETSDAPIIKLVNLLLSGATKDRASDIHIEPYQATVKVRYRIDGILYDILSLPRKIQSPLVSRVKIMAKLNIAEKRLPQDGRIEIKVADRSVDIRVSTIPTAFGERVVLQAPGQDVVDPDAFRPRDGQPEGRDFQPADQVALRDRPRDGAHGEREDDDPLRGALEHQLRPR